MFFLFVGTFALCWNSSSAQITINPSKLAFGTTLPSTQWVVDIIVQNRSDKKDFLLRTTFSHEYDVVASSKTLLPDSSITIRVKFKPRLKGPFNEKIEFHFASLNEPIIFPVTADVQYLNPEDHLACPDFSRQAADCCVDNTVLFEVVNAETGEPIKGAEIRIEEDKVVQSKLATNAEGKISKSMPIGYYRLTALHQNFLKKDIVSYVNNGHAYFRFELDPVKNEIIEDIPPIAEVVPDIVVTSVKSDSMEVLVPESVVLPESKYKLNNMVFLLDASSSMNKGERMDLMRKSMHELINALRPGDKITLISYNDQAKVLLETTTGGQKDVLHITVDHMLADGNTAGAKGFKMAYSILKEEYIKEGNNQLIVVTDGAFQPEDQKEIDKLVKKASKKKLVTSLVGIQPNTFAAGNLEMVGAMGHGSFVLIEDETDLTQILEEIKKQSAK
ncbi:MAG: vWA domain-containing protein [Flavobacteriales bacterium]